MARFITYSFIHQSLMHAVFALVFILAIGKFVAEEMHPLAVLLIFLASAATSAFVYSLLLNDHTALIGAFPAIYGLLGAYTWLHFTKLTSEGENGLRAFALVFALLAITLVFLLIGWFFQSARFGGMGIWLTQLIGFIVGFLLSVVLAPDGRHRVQSALRRIRQR
jgi:membrane associated rhomboid family serine protease